MFGPGIHLSPRAALWGLIAGWLALFWHTSASADSLLSVPAAATASDFICPTAASARAGAHPPVADEADRMPPIAALGSLARPVVRQQPVFDQATIPGFVLRDASGPRPRRIAVWGDSHVAAGAFMQTILEGLRGRGFSVAPRYLPPTMGRANVRLPTLHAYCIGSAWTTELAYTAGGPVQVGPALINRVAEAGAESYLWLDFRDADKRANLRRLQIVYCARVGAVLAISVNGGPELRAVLVRDAQSQTLTVQSDEPVGVLKLRVTQGRLVLHGFILDYARPPIVTFDVFGVPSATARGWANLDPGYLKQALHGGDYDGVILEYGTNEAADAHFDRDTYTAGLRAALQNVRRAFPRASCLLVGPPDRGVLERRDGPLADIASYAKIVGLVEAAQAQVAGQFGCVQWNWQALMGGEGGSYGWALASPPLMGRDLTHPTATGYKLTGEALARSLGF